MASRCGDARYRCDRGGAPCAVGDVCDVRGCERTAGVCVPRPAACPTDGIPRCTCGSGADPFGRAWANECERVRADAVLDVYGNAPFAPCAASCGGPDDLACPPGLWCSYPEGTCGDFRGHGRCVEMPTTCPEAPACGCDGADYPTACAALEAGGRVAHHGACGTRCGGPTGFACAAGLRCAKDWGTCEQAEQWGDCRVVTDATCLSLPPVCGCDGRLYARPCDAIMADVQVRGLPVDGACPGPPGGRPRRAIDGRDLVHAG